VAVTASLAGLAPDTGHAYRLVAFNPAGSATGSELAFTTGASLPVAATLAASGATTSGAVLNGVIVPNGSATSYWFEYGTTTAYGMRTATNTLAAGFSSIPVSAVIGGLQIASSYHFRIVAANAYGVVSGSDQSFTSLAFQGVPPVPSLANGVPAWGDYDNDGLPDLLLVGNDIAGTPARIWRNNGSGFTNIGLALPAVTRAAAAWGDYDNDGRLDFAISGETGAGFVTEVWHNTGTNFVKLAAALTGTANGSLAWGDYDNDGRLDLLITGEAVGLPPSIVTELWRNTGDGFAKIDAGFPGIQGGTALWADYDGDGFQDVLITGSTNRDSSGAITRVYRNTGSGFVDMDAGIIPLASSCAAWGDYDGDGRLDVVVAGIYPGMGEPRVCQIWRNTGTGFVLGEAALPGVASGSVSWGDYDNDGRPDLFVTGENPFGQVAEIFRNTGAGFASIGAGLTASGSGYGSWADINGDGRLDVLLTGVVDNGVFAEIRQNIVAAPNSLPQPPGQLNASASGGGIRFRWNAALDLETPASALTYNLRVGTTPGGSDVVAPAADAAGLRRLQAMGNHQLATNAFLQLPAGTYYWSVQSVDSGYLGSAFAPEQIIRIGGVVAAPRLTGVQMQGGNVSKVTFTGSAGASFQVLGSSNAVLPMSAWTVLGTATETSPGVFEFIDTGAGSSTMRFYGARSQ
jgi:hypothetical protein